MIPVMYKREGLNDGRISVAPFFDGPSWLVGVNSGSWIGSKHVTLGEKQEKVTTALLAISMQPIQKLMVLAPINASGIIREYDLRNLRTVAKHAEIPNLLKILVATTNKDKEETIFVVTEDQFQLHEIVRICALSPSSGMPPTFSPLASTCVRSFQVKTLSSKGLKGFSSDPIFYAQLEKENIELTLIQWRLHITTAGSVEHERHLDEICGVHLNDSTSRSNHYAVLRIDFQDNQCIVLMCAKSPSHQNFVATLTARINFLRIVSSSSMNTQMGAQKGKNSRMYRLSVWTHNTLSRSLRRPK